MRVLLLAAVLAATGCAQTPPSGTTEAVPDTMATPPRIGPVFVGPMRADPVVDAASLIQAMHARHAATWYRTLSFTQATSRVLPDGEVSQETWREWAALPGRLRIEMDDPMAGVDVLFVGDTTYVYRDGALAMARADRNPLLLWGFDVYAQDPAETLRLGAQAGMDLDAFRMDLFENRPMYVVGEPESGEVWIEQDRLLFVRLVEPGDGGGMQDVRFADYEPLGGGWIAPLVEVYADGERVFWEVYSDLVADPDLDPVLFDPARWAEGVATGAR